MLCRILNFISLMKTSLLEFNVRKEFMNKEYRYNLHVWKNSAMSTWSISSKRLSRLKRSTWSSMCKPSAPMDSPSSSHSSWWLCKTTEFSNDIVATSESAKKMAYTVNVTCWLLTPEVKFVNAVKCKIFASGVNFSRNNAVYYINDSTKYVHVILISSLKLLTHY